MKYFVYDNQRKGTCYHEFYKGQWDGKTFWKSDSLFLHDDFLFHLNDLVDAIIEIAPCYDPYGETEITIEQWNKIGEIVKGKNKESQEAYREADLWLKGEVFPKYECFTILGI